MTKFDVWVDLPNSKGGEVIEEYVGSFEGYLVDITASVLTLYPAAIGIMIVTSKE